MPHALVGRLPTYLRRLMTKSRVNLEQPVATRFSKIPLTPGVSLISFVSKSGADID